MIKNDDELIWFFREGVPIKPGSDPDSTEAVYCVKYRHFSVQGIGTGSARIEATLENVPENWVEIATVDADKLVAFSGVFTALRAVQLTGANAFTLLMRRSDQQTSV